MFTAVTAATLMWVGLLLLPWRPWTTAERISAGCSGGDVALDHITALIPARDEAECIEQTLKALDAQGNLHEIILIDDQSSDGTGAIARGLELSALKIIDGTDPPAGWSGKLWALEQGARVATSEFVLLMDADIELAPDFLPSLVQLQRDHDLALTSVMAHLHMGSISERLLLPPFIYFFKLIYPFSLSNKPTSKVAAAAGGLILLRKADLEMIGGFGALHDAIIDDCTLAKRVKSNGGKTWIGLSQDVKAVRPYGTLAAIWNMVARTAFTQLHYSTALLLVCTVLLTLSFLVPAVGLLAGSAEVQVMALGAYAAMALSYLPTVRYYGLSHLWIITLPLAATLYLAMTWTSAWRYWSGERSRWKNRSYER